MGMTTRERAETILCDLDLAQEVGEGIDRAAYLIAAIEAAVEQERAEAEQREALSCIAELRKYGFHAAADALVEAAEARKKLENA